MKKTMYLLYAELASAFSWGYGHYLTDSIFFKWLCVVMGLGFAIVFISIYLGDLDN